MRLSFKFLAAFLLTSLMMLGVLLATQYLAGWNFDAYLGQVEQERTSGLLSDLPALYDARLGWEPLRRDPGRWRDLLHSHGFDIPSDPERRPGGDRPPPDRRDDRGPPPPRPPRREDRRDRPGPPPAATEEPWGLGPRLSLYDLAKGYVVGDRRPPEDLLLRAITVNGEAVGWLGLRPRQSAETPLEAAFLKRQLRLLLVVGGCLLLLTGLVALVVSRQVVRPVRALSQATRALSRRRLETRTKVATSDEFGQLAADFNRMAATIQAHEQERRQWIADIAHELRTPLAILRGEIEALQDGVRELRPEALDSLHAEVVRLGKLVEDLHQLTLAESGTLAVRREPVDLINIVRGTVDLFRVRCDRHDLDLRLDLPAGEAIIRGDADRLQQVVSNVLENGLRYAGAGAQLSIRALVNPTHVVVQIRDSGPGVPDDALPHLFERLYRVEKSRSRQLGGSGLGLAICKQIVDAHGGEIRAANSPAGGLIITIVLPLAGL